MRVFISYFISFDFCKSDSPLFFLTQCSFYISFSLCNSLHFSGLLKLLVNEDIL